MPQAAVLNLGFFGVAFLGLESLGAIIAMILGLGVLVFVHELGHFLAAKWVGVRVEVFSLGFGPRLFGFVKGTTDYRISALPLGGYVKMLGQDDADPNSPKTSEHDDFRNKSIGGRTLILIAGVVMNSIFALLAFILAFSMGVEFTAPEVGAVTANSAASQATLVGGPEGARVGLAPGDQILRINGSSTFAWEDVTTTIALSNGPVLIDIARPDSTTGVAKRLTFEATPRRDENSAFPRLGIDVMQVVGDLPDDSPARAKGLQKDDRLIDVEPKGVPLSSRDLRQIDATIRDNPGKPVVLRVERRSYDADGRPLEKATAPLDIEASPLARPTYDVGIEFDPDTVRVAAIQSDKPAHALLEAGDIVASIDGRPVSETNFPLVVKAAGDAHFKAGSKLSDPVIVAYQRRGKDGTWERHEGPVTLVRRDNDEGWLLGVDYLCDRIKSVEPGSPAAGAGVKAGDFVKYVYPDTFLGFYLWGKVRAKDDVVAKICNEKAEQPWKLVWEPSDGKTTRDAVLQARKTGREFGDLKLALIPRGITVRRGIGGACALGADRTAKTFQQLVYTLRGLFGNSVSTKELGGPIQIATITFKIATSKGFGNLLNFLAILSVNLAVLNILPIPVLDGGHIFLLGIEKLKGRPLSDDVMRYVQYAGLAFVLILMVYVTYNDIRRVFE
jgi:regulator of sigma E protease